MFLESTVLQSAPPSNININLASSNPSSKVKSKGSIKELTRQYHIWYPLIFKTNTISIDDHSHNIAAYSPNCCVSMEDSLPFLLLVRIFSISIDAAENLNKKSKQIINNNNENNNEIQDRWTIAACAYWIYVITSSIKRKIKLESLPCRFLSPLLLSYISAIRYRTHNMADSTILEDVNDVINKFIDNINQVNNLVDNGDKDINNDKDEVDNSDDNDDDWLGNNYSELNKFEEWKDLSSSVDSTILNINDREIDKKLVREVDDKIVDNNNNKKQKLSKLTENNNNINNNNNNNSSNPWTLCTDLPMWPIGFIPGHSTSSKLYTVIDNNN
jgi:hypothetical protein